MAQEIKRLRYFDGLILKEDEFNLEQDYHIRMRRLHNLNMHGWGIVRGLDLELTSQNNMIRITPGLAMDKSHDSKFGEDQSHEILVADNIDVEFSNSEFSPGDTIYVWLSFAEDMTDVIPDRGGNEPIHWRESVVVGYGAVKPIDEATDILLGKLLFGDDGSGGISLNGEGVSIILQEDDGRNIRTLAGATQIRVETESLYLVDNLMGQNVPYMDGKHFDLGGGVTVDGIDIVSDHSHFSGDVQISGNLQLTGDVKVNEISSDLSVATGNEAASLPTVSSVKSYVDGLSGNSDTRILALENQRDADISNDSIAVRNEFGRLRVADATAPDEAMTFGQFEGKGFSGSISSVNAVISDLNEAIETGYYFCAATLANIPVTPAPQEKGLLIVLKEADEIVHQEFLSTQSAKRFTRNLVGVTWSDWVESMTQSTLDAHGASDTDHDSHYYNLNGTTPLLGDMHTGGNRILDLIEPLDDTEPARLLELNGVITALNDHKSSHDHDSQYYQSSYFDGDIDTLTTNGVVTLESTATNTPVANTAGILHMNSSLDGLSLRQIFISLAEDRIWMRRGTVSIVDSSITYESWVELLSQATMDAHIASNSDHNTHYYNLDGNTALAADMNAGTHKITNLGAPTIDTDAARVIEVQTVTDALDAHKISNDHDGNYSVQRDYTGDLDLLDIKGVASIGNSSTNMPVAGISGLVRMSSSPDETLVSQVFQSLEDDRVWSRRGTVGSPTVWSSWTPVWSNDQIQRDLSNPAASWIKYPDGTMEQFGYIEDTASITYPYTVSFPTSFDTLQHVELVSLDANLSYTSRPSAWTATGFNITGGSSHDVAGHTADPAEIAVAWRARGTYTI